MNRDAACLALGLCMSVIGCAGSGARDPGEVQAGAPRITAFQDGVAPTASYAGTRDTFLEQSHPSTSHGGDARLSISGDTPAGSGNDDVVLVQWDLTAIPTSAIVRAATLTLTVTDRADQPYAVFEALRPWSEATSTWKRASAALNWETHGAEGGSDRGATALGVIQAATTGSYLIALNSAGVAAVQRWVTDPTTNHGVVLAGPDNDNRLEIASREGSKPSRPRIEVSWEAGTGGVRLDPRPGTYRHTCDGSGAIALDFTYFLDLSDEDQVARIYARTATTGPVQEIDLSAGLGLPPGDEADLEDAARVGDRVYVIGSHGRDKNGAIVPARYRFAAIDLSGAPPALGVAVAGSSARLLTDMLDAARWAHPDAAFLSALHAASQLSRSIDPSLSPELEGVNLEGLARYPSPTNPDRLVIGLRNPHASDARAILVTLENPAQLVAGAAAQLGEVIPLDLSGLGIRGMAWSEAHQAMLVIGGPIADAGVVRLFRWSGDPASAPVPIQDLVGPAGAAAEAVVPYPGTKDVQILFDFGAVLVDDTECKKLPASLQSFTDVIVRVE